MIPITIGTRCPKCNSNYLNAKKIELIGIKSVLKGLFASDVGLLKGLVGRNILIIDCNACNKKFKPLEGKANTILLNRHQLNFGQSKLTKVNPIQANDYYVSGIIKSSHNNHIEAIADYAKAIEIDPKCAAAYVIRGYSKIFVDDYSGAILDYTKAIELDPKNADWYVNRGEAKVLIEDYIGAKADYTQAIKIDKKKAIVAYARRGYVKSYLSDYYGSLSDYSKAYDFDPDPEENAYYRKSGAEAYIREFKSIAGYTKAIEINPANAEAYCKGLCKRVFNGLHRCN